MFVVGDVVDKRVVAVPQNNVAGKERGGGPPGSDPLCGTGKVINSCAEFILGNIKYNYISFYYLSKLKTPMAQAIEILSHISCIIMPPPLGAGGIMFSGCPSVRPSVHPSEAWNTLFWPVHRSVGPPDQPLPFYGMSVRPSVRPSVHPSVRLSVRPSVRPSGEVFGHLPEIAWRD